MKISGETLQVLKNFASINTNIVFKPGDTIATISSAKNIFSRAKIQEEIPNQFAIYDLNSLLAMLSLVDDQEVKFEDNKLQITSASGTFEYFYSNPDVVTSAPDGAIDHDAVYKFKLTAEDIQMLLKAAAITNAPTVSVMSLVSDRDRHLIMLGTETTIGTAVSQDKLFIRFSDQENISDYTPTSVNTAGSIRLDSGTKIVGAVKGKDYTFILTDTSAYVMQFVGPPFTFSIRQVGSNCGAIGQHSIKYVNGAVYWMGESGGFFVYDGTVKSLPCLVEDFVFKTTGDNLGINYDEGESVYAGLNHLYEEITWFYVKSGSSSIDRCVTYNYQDQIWATGSLNRTTWMDASLYSNVYATEFESSSVPTFPTVQGVTNVNGATIYYQHETGVDQVDAAGAKTAIPAFIKSGDFDLTVGGDGQMFMSIRRFIPDFKVLQGNARITINLKRFPSQTETSSPLGPFTINSSTEKVDTRARSRFASLKVENTTTDESWRYGTFRADVQPDGMR